MPKSLSFDTIDATWTLFLDRDGVLNTQSENKLILKLSDFEWIEGSKESISSFNQIFGLVLIVSNQHAVGMSWMTSKDLDEIHARMLAEIEESDGYIHNIYYCPDAKESNSFNRKPQIGMALQAKKDFPQINFKKSVMVGDNITDMMFGKRLKMKTVLIQTDTKLISENANIIDLAFPCLKHFAAYLNKTL